MNGNLERVKNLCDNSKLSKEFCENIISSLENNLENKCKLKKCISNNKKSSTLNFAYITGKKIKDHYFDDDIVKNTDINELVKTLFENNYIDVLKEYAYYMINNGKLPNIQNTYLLNIPIGENDRTLEDIINCVKYGDLCIHNAGVEILNFVADLAFSFPNLNINEGIFYDINDKKYILFPIKNNDNTYNLIVFTNTGEYDGDYLDIHIDKYNSMKSIKYSNEILINRLKIDKNLYEKCLYYDI